MVSADDGDYYRLLIPGTYEITVTAAGYADATATNVVVDNAFQTPAKEVNFQLSPTVEDRGYSLEELRAIERVIDRQLDLV